MEPAGLASVRAALALIEPARLRRGEQLVAVTEQVEANPRKGTSLWCVDDRVETYVEIHLGRGTPAWVDCDCGLRHCEHIAAALMALAPETRAPLTAQRAQTANSPRELIDLARSAGHHALLAAPLSGIVPGPLPAELATRPIGSLEGRDLRTLPAATQAAFTRILRQRLSTETPAPEPPPPSLVAWARTCGLDDVLQWPARDCQIAALHTFIQRHAWPLRDRPLAEGIEALERQKPNALVDGARADVHAWLTRLAAMRQAAAAEAQACAQHPPPRPEGVLGEAYDALERLRNAELALGPRRWPSAAFAIDTRFGHDPFRIGAFFTVADPRDTFLSNGSPALALDGWRTKIGIECRCRIAAPCPHRLLLIETVQRRLSDGPPESLDLLREAFARQPWHHLLEALAPAPPSTDELCFHVVAHDGGIDRIDLYTRPRGARTKGKKTAVDRARSLPLTREEARALDAAAQSRKASRSYAPRFEVADADFRMLDALVGHPRVFDRAGALTVIRATCTVEVRETDGGFTLTLGASGVALPGPALAALRDAIRTGPPRLAWVGAGWCVLVERPPQLEALCAAVERFGGFLPPEAGPALADRLDALRAHVALDLPPGLAGEECPADARPQLGLRLDPDGGLSVSWGVCPIAGASVQPTGEGPARIYFTEGGKRRWAQRRFDDEHARRAALLKRIPALGEPRVSAADAADVVGALEAAPAEVHVVWEGGALRRGRPALASDVKLQIRKRRDWFGVEGSATIDGAEIALTDLLAAVHAGRRHVRVGPDRAVPLSEELRRRLRVLGSLARTTGGDLELDRAALPVIEDVTDGFAAVKAPEEWTQLVARLRDARAEVPALPAGLRTDLRDYQRRGFEWLGALGAWGAGACLADDMGLGKTVQALAVLLHRAALGPALVIAPTSVCGNWVAEAKRFAPTLDVRLHHGGDRDRSLEGLKAGSVVLTSYGVLVRDAALLAEREFATAVFDEAHALKNSGTARAQAARGLTAAFRVALTGTPLENRLGELWSLFRLLVPGLLGSEETFRARFVRPIEVDGDAGARDALAQVIRPFLLRRLKAEVARELPARTETTVRVEPDRAERARYEEERRVLAAELAGVEEGQEQRARVQVLAALTRLRQLACHPALIDADWSAGSAKLDHLVALVETLRAEGHRVLVFSQFVRLLELVRPALEAAGVRVLQLDGGTSQPDRVHRVERFQAGEADVFLLSLKAGGVGLNLTAATYVVHLDPWWNPAAEDQATDRAHRIGQTQPVTVYRLVTAGTIEEQILQLHAEKRALVEGVLAGTGAAGSLDVHALLALLKGDGSAG